MMLWVTFFFWLGGTVCEVSNTLSLFTERRTIRDLDVWLEAARWPIQAADVLWESLRR